MNLKNSLNSFISNKLGYRTLNRSQEHIGPYRFSVVPESLRKSDYDDAWLVMAGHNHKFIVDVGCNMGQSSLLLLSNTTVEKILLCDPNPAALAIAAENLIYNQLIDKADFICSLIGNKQEDQVRFYTTGTGAAGSLYLENAHTAKKKHDYITSSMQTLDALVSKLSWVPDFIKIDVEGAEFLVLEGAQKLVQKSPATFLVEMHSSASLSMSQNTDLVLGWCRKVGYRAWYLKDKIEVTHSNQVAKRGRCHILLLPQTKIFPPYLQGIAQSHSVDELFTKELST